MKLSYRGHPYEAHLPHLEQEQVEQIGVYRGAPLMRKRFHVPHGQHHRVQLKYRGATYSQEV